MLRLLGNPPFVTLAVTVACVALFLPPLSAISPARVCLLPSRLLSALQLYRIFTYAFFHAGFFHILFNLIACFMLVGPFENSVGSLAAAYLIFVLFVPLTAILQTALAYALDALASTRFRHDCSVGISALLFSVLVVNVHAARASHLSFFGFFRIPAPWYPWLLAAVLQLLSPRLSLMGHVSGILLGHALVLHRLDALLPSDDKLQHVERVLHLTALPCWKSNPSLLPIFHPTSPFLPYTASPPSSDSPSSGSPSLLHRFSAFVSRPFSSLHNHSPFSAQGHTLGADPQSPARATIPPHSRLLRQSAPHQSRPEHTPEPPSPTESSPLQPAPSDALPQST